MGKQYLRKQGIGKQGLGKQGLGKRGLGKRGLERHGLGKRGLEGQYLERQNFRGEVWRSEVYSDITIVNFRWQPTGPNHGVKPVAKRHHMVRGSLALPFAVVKSQRVAGERPLEGTKSCRMGKNSVRPLIY